MRGVERGARDRWSIPRRRKRFGGPLRRGRRCARRSMPRSGVRRLDGAHGVRARRDPQRARCGDPRPGRRRSPGPPCLESGKPLARRAVSGSSRPICFEWFAEEGKRAYGRDRAVAVGTRRLTVLRSRSGGRRDHGVELPGLQRRAGRGGARRRLHGRHPPVGVHAADGDRHGADSRGGRRCQRASSRWSTAIPMRWVRRCCDHPACGRFSSPAACGSASC